ncbi:N-alpha-acetyltransferase [Babesia sp. Xinjiang]|uniref:N-alpha-acetyltransferase n=1 Tax=Babesia sp. Xinjiang TaxID=462227 RepID=UPI000A240DFE|nr:N-alpha-acetyltransferase [Babesia sp. Xinjiang]ORM39441.1 N-alpha-acetyltransferase [Babesia sp. Xinjiang]
MMDLYNQKQYKKALKIAESLLAKHPKNGEVVSFKALLLSNIEPSKADEIMELARQGLKYDVKSYLCWYVLGAIYKQRKLYKDSLKCFTMATKIDTKNDRLMKDVCALAIEINDFAAFRKFSNQILEIRLKYYKEWMTFAFAQHLCGNVEAACKIVQEANSLFEGKYEAEPFELSSSFIYWAMILEQSGRYNECINVLIDKQKYILDDIMRLDYVGRAAIKSQQWDLAHDAYRQLITLNPDNARYVILYIVTHETVRDRGIFQMPIPKINRALTDENVTQMEDNSTGPEATEFTNKVLQGVMPPILLSEEIMDIEGEFSSNNWCVENKINRIYDRFVNIMREKAENKTDTTKDEQLFDGCHCYADYTAKVSKAFNVKHLPKPETLEVKDVETVLRDYLKEYPIARNCVYSTRPKITSWSRYPLFFFIRELTSEESQILINALNEVKTNNYLGKALTISFTVDDHIGIFHDVVQPLVEGGCTSIVKFFAHGSTFSTAYRLLVLLVKYQQNLVEGHPLGHNIAKSQNITNAVTEISAQDQIMAQNYLVLVQIVTAKLYDYLGLYREGLQVLEQTLETTPTAVDAYLVMGKIYRHLGAFDKSRRAFCMASDIDRSDRQTSSKAAKAILRAHDFETSRYKWKSFLVEDVGKGPVKEKKEEKTRDAPPEVRSMKFELMATEQYRIIYLQNSSKEDTDGTIKIHSGELLKKAHDVYTMVLERQHEIYRNQLDFHNYCLNRLQYRTYYIFHQIRAAYTTLIYFIEAVKGILWTTAEMRKLEIQHNTVHSRTVESVTQDHNVDYCIDLIKLISSQRAYDTGLYSAIHKFAVTLDLPLAYRVQCVIRTHYAANNNPLHHHLYPMVYKLIKESQYKNFVRGILQVLPTWADIVLDQDKRVFMTSDKRELTDVEAADLYLEGIVDRLQKTKMMDYRHCEAILQCYYCGSPPSANVVPGGDSYVDSIPTFRELREHHLELRNLLRRMQDAADVSPIRDLLNSVEETLRNKYPEFKILVE